MTKNVCCGCFGFSFTRKQKGVPRPSARIANHASNECLINVDLEDDDGDSNAGGVNATTGFGNTNRLTKHAELILMHRIEHGLICRQFPAKDTHRLIRSEDENGNKMINEYVRERKIGVGSYGKVLLYRNTIDGKHYAIKAFHKSHLSRLRVAPSETAMTDVLREVSIMKTLEHPNVVNLFEVINDPKADQFYMVLEYVEGKLVFEGSDPLGGLGEDKARKYLRDIVSGLMYLHAHNIVHADIKPDNVLITDSGIVKIGDFSVSQVFEGNNDELRRSPGTPVFTAPECCMGLTYGGKGADTWAVGVTLYCMIMGKYPFLGENLQETYDKIVNKDAFLHDDMNPLLKSLLQGLLCKDPLQRLKLEAVAEHPWMIAEDQGCTLPQYLCWCKRKGVLSK